MAGTVPKLFTIYQDINQLRAIYGMNEGTPIMTELDDDQRRAMTFFKPNTVHISA
jgi:hypothetical protein